MGKILAVTGCPTGIAHTFMAEEALKKAAAELGVDIKVETNGAVGVANELTEEDIRDADGIIVASDKDARTYRFAGKRVIEVPVADGIRRPKELIEQILAGDVEGLGREHLVDPREHAGDVAVDVEEAGGVALDRQRHLDEVHRADGGAAVGIAGELFRYLGADARLRLLGRTADVGGEDDVA